MNILGISAYFHDSSAALIQNGEICAAAQEERFSRQKHDERFPANAVAYCIRQANITLKEIDALVFYEKPLIKFERLLETYLAFAPKGFHSFFKAIPQWLQQKLHIPREIDKELGGAYDGPIFFTNHHTSHAASAFYPSPFSNSAILTIDGVGEWTTTSWGVGRDNDIKLQEEIIFPHSLGLLYSAFTYYTGFRVNSGEYKLMGLAPYGKPRYAGLIRDNLIEIKDDGSFRLNQKYFSYCYGLTMTSKAFHKLFGAPPRKPESPITQFQMDLAASIQAVLDEVVLKICSHIHRQTKTENLCLAGGVALNCVANGRILEQGLFKNIWIQPASGDAGGALGAALYCWYQYFAKPRRIQLPDAQKGSYLGPEFSTEEIRAELDQMNAVYRLIPNEEELADVVAGRIASGGIVGHFFGRAEFGPRALGHRSILGDPRDPTMQSRMNMAIKFRESFRPFAPSVLRERCSEFFKIDTESPYMLVVADVVDSQRIQAPESEKTFGVDNLKIIRSTLPSITHIDYSARIQTVDIDRAPRFYYLLKAFQKMTGCPVLVNTSFNIRGEPIVHSPSDAYRCFMYTDMDFLVINNFVLEKKQQPAMPGSDNYRNSFKLD
jgi:carbamoyltransferase